MSLRFVVLNILHFLSILTYGQKWAGLPKEACGDLGVMIGSNEPCEGCCYLWTPAEDLSCTDCKNPIATPKTTKKYSVVVTDHNLRKIGADVVEVTTVFKEMHFMPDHLVQGDPESEVIASIKDPGNADLPSEITWSLVPPFLGCMIEQEGVDAKIKPGPQFGKVMVKAINQTVSGCYVQKELPVNKGVKDVVAVDNTSPSTRMARHGETLYVLNDMGVKIEAIPNEGGNPEGLPDWQQDTYGSQMPNDGDWSSVIFEPLPENPLDSKTSQYIAGELPEGNPKVTVIRKKQAVTGEIPKSIPGMEELDDKLATYFRFVNQPEAPCGNPLPFSIAITLPESKLKISEVERYQHPGLGVKEEITFAAGLVASGRIYHPALTKTFNIEAFGQQVIFCSRLYAELTGTVDISLPLIKSDSLQDNTWKAADPSLTAGFGISVDLQAALIPDGFMILASAKAKSKIDFIFTYSVAEKKVSYQIKIEPCTATASLNIKYESDPGTYEDLLPKVLTQYLSGSFELFKPNLYGPFHVYSF